MKRRLLVLPIVAGLLLQAVPSSAFVFRGSGFGHGIGLSQHGALGLAQKGWGAVRIVKHFFRGATVQARTPPAPTFRIGLLQNRSVTTLTAEQAPFDLVLASGGTIDTASAGQVRKIEITGDQKYRVVRGNGTVVGTFGGPSNPLRAQRHSGGILLVSEWGHRLGRGSLEVVIAGPGKGHAVALLAPEEYLYGLGEVPSSWPLAALQAQAIPARTYAYRKVTDAANRPECACALYASTLDQVYLGWEKEAGPGGSRWVSAVNGTAKKVLVHNGQPIYAFYSSSSGGFTENIEKVWTGSSPRPYLRGVCDPGDFTSANPYRTWTVKLSGEAVANKLGKPNGMARAKRFQILERGVSGRVVRARVHGVTSSGSAVAVTRTGWSLRGSLGLRDSRWWVNQNRQITGLIRKKYDGTKCRPGLARTRQKKIKGGAFQVFQRGRIYRHNKLKRAVWLKGPVLRKYVKVGAHKRFLKRPRAFKWMKPGRRAIFDRGEIYWKKKPGAHVLRKRVLKKYRRLGGPKKSRLGFPTSDTRFVSGAQRANFQRGKIICFRGRACRVRRG